MKITTLSSFFLVVICLACSDQDKSREVKLSGQIINPAGEEIALYIDPATGPVKDTLDSAGNFSVGVQLDHPKVVTFEHGKQYTRIFIKPGDQINFKVDASSFKESISFEGTSAAINNFQSALTMLRDSLPGYWQTMALEEAEFLRVTDSVTRVKLEMLENTSGIDPVAKDYYVTMLKLENASNKLNYPKGHKRHLKSDSFEVSEEYYSFLETIDENDTTLLSHPNFTRYLQTRVRTAVSKKFGSLSKEEQNPATYYSLQLDVIKDLFEAKPVQRDVLYDLVYNSFTYLEDDIRGEMLSYWKADLNPKPVQLKNMNEKAEKWAKLAPGNVAPDFRYVSINGDSLSLDDLRGKLVYVDVWATWCGPCVREHPAMEKLQDEFEGKDVAFVAVSIDGNQDPWKKMVQEKELGGTHLWAPGAWSSTVIKDYMIHGIPRFILIDSEGRIIDVNAERPSGNIGEELTQLLNSKA